MSATSCSIGRQGFAIGYTLVACVFVATILYFVIKLLQKYCRLEADKRPSKWLFAPNLFYVLLCLAVLIKCTVYGVSHCDYAELHEDAQHLVFNIIFRDLYVIQLYFLWLVLLIRIYFMFMDTPYMLSKITIRVYSIIFIFSPLLTVLLSVPSLYAIFIVLGLSGGIFITLSIIIVYIFKLIQVYTRYSENEQHKNEDEIGLLSKITKNTILVIMCTLFSLLILFILIMNFVFSVYSIEYGYQEQFLHSCLLLDTYVKAICVIFQFRFFHAKYEYFCGCIDIVCRYYCNQFVNPAAYNVGHSHALHAALPPVVDEKHHFSQRSSLPLEGGGARAANQNTVLLIHASNMVDAASAAEEEKATEEELQESASYDTGRKLEKAELESIPSLPTEQQYFESAYIAKPAARNTANHLPVPAKNANQSKSPKINPYWNNYQGIALDQEEHKEMLHLSMNQDSINIHKVLTRAGFDENYTKRALVVYEKYYGHNYDIRIIREIIYRLTIKDKLKELKRVKTFYQSREAVERILLALNFSSHYVNTGLAMYEVTAEMFDIHKHHGNVYDLELVTEMIMRLRAKDRERGDLVEDGDDIIMHNETNQTTDRQAMRVVDGDGGDGVIETNPYDGYYAQLSTQQVANIVNPRVFSADVDADAPSSDEDENRPYGHRQRLPPPQPQYGVLAQPQQARYDEQGMQTPESSEMIAAVVAGRAQHHLANDYEVNEITVNTNDMDIDGEESEESTQEQVNVHANQSANHNVNANKHRERDRRQSPSHKSSKSRSQLKNRAKKNRSGSKKSKSKSASPMKTHEEQRSGFADTGYFVNRVLAHNNAELHKRNVRDMQSASGGSSSSQSASASTEAEIETETETESESESSKQRKRNHVPQISIQAAPAQPDMSEYEYMYELYASQYGKPESAQYLISFAQQRGQRMSFAMAQALLDGHADAVVSPPDDMVKRSRAESHSRSLQEIKKIQGLIHREIHNVQDQHGNMDDDMDDMLASENNNNTNSDDDDDDDEEEDDGDEIIEMDSDEDENENALLHHREMEEANIRPIPKYRPNSQERTMIPIVPDNAAQNYKYRSPSPHKSHSENDSDVEYDQEYYDEDLDENENINIVYADRTQPNKAKPNKMRSKAPETQTQQRQSRANSSNPSHMTESPGFPAEMAFNIHVDPHSSALKKNQDGTVSLFSPISPHSVASAALEVDYTKVIPSSSLVAANGADSGKHYNLIKPREKVDTKKSPKLYSSEASKLNNSKMQPLELDNGDSTESY